MKVTADRNKCISCLGCVSVCPVMALNEKDHYPDCDQRKCTGCSTCVRFCPAGALKLEGKA